MFNNFGTTEILVVAAIVVLLFGGKKIPELVRGIAEAIREFRRSSKDKAA
jgi:sec-independent protein translocase protein TatA